MRRWSFLASVVMSACLSPVVDELAPLDASVEPVDAGEIDAGEIDSGEIDAGQLDAGELDAGSSDAGPPDAGTPDAGRPDAGSTFDAGHCTTVPLVPLSEFASSPRADRGLELLVLHADSSRFSVDDATYQRAAR